MSFREPHELHKRRFGRNLGLGLVLAGFVALIFGLTVAKVTSDDFSIPTEMSTEKPTGMSTEEAGN